MPHSGLVKYSCDVFYRRMMTVNQWQLQNDQHEEIKHFRHFIASVVTYNRAQTSLLTDFPQKHC